MNEGMSMNRTMRGLAVLAIGVGAWACKGDPQGDLRGDAVKVNASPASIFVNQGETALVQIEVVDAQENALGITDFAMTASSAVVSVAEDVAFNNIYDAAGNAVRPSPWTRARFEVTGVNTGSATLTASGGGVSLDIPVRVVPVSLLTGAVSNATPALTEVVTITMPAGVVLDPATSTVTFSDGSVPANVVVDPAGTSVSFLAAPNTNAPATVTNATMTYAPSIPAFSLETEETLTAVAVTSVPVTYSNDTPAGGEIVTMTAGAGYKFTPASVVSLLGGQVYQISVAADSSSIDFVPSTSYAQNLPPNITAVSLVGTPFVVDLPADIFFTSGPGLAGTDDQATAPTITIPAAGTSTTFYDGGPYGAGLFGADRIYNFSIVAPTTFVIDLDWSNTSDVDILVLDNPASGFFCGFGGATGNQPEQLTCNALLTGNYSLVINLYAGAAADVLKITLTTP